jgi:UDPglucose--hexose-1-phosphate uridylyltransferase
VQFKAVGADKKMENEMRRDYLTDRWVILAPRRAKRPSDFAVKRSRAEPKVCAFCSGNENLTPPAKLLYVRKGNQILRFKDLGRRRRSDWAVRCIPNMFPAVSRMRTSAQGPSHSHFIKRPAAGVHEIIIESPNHDDHPHQASEGQVELWLTAAIERIRELGRSKDVASIILFRNHGREAGASIAHAHSQIITTPIVPSRIKEEYQGMKRFEAQTSNCALCQIRRLEGRGPRRIANLSAFTVFAPWASIFPFEFWVVPKRHSTSILTLSQNEIRNLAEAIQSSFKALAKTLLDPPYNAVFHLGPTRFRDSTYHWHMEVYPKVSTLAGFELGSGMYINTMKPETAAKALAQNLH